MSQSSQSSEDEQLLSLQEMMERVTKPPDTPEKEAFSEPSTPRHHSSKLRTVSSKRTFLYCTYTYKCVVNNSSVNVWIFNVICCVLFFPQQPLPSTTKPGHYKNNLDQILKEMDTIKKYIIQKNLYSHFFFNWSHSIFNFVHVHLICQSKRDRDAASQYMQRGPVENSWIRGGWGEAGGGHLLRTAVRPAESHSHVLPHHRDAARWM